jgi:hypothetical protein
MLNETDTVGHTFKRAFYRVDGVTMYVCWALWLGGFIWGLFDPARPGVLSLIIFMCGLMSPFFYLILGLARLPSLLTAIIIAGFNIWAVFS